MSGAVVGIAIGTVLALGAGATWALSRKPALPSPGPVCHLCPAGHGYLGDEDLADHVEAFHPDAALRWVDDEDAEDAAAAMIHRSGER